MIVYSGLCTPADVKSRSDVLLGPLHDGAELIPVCDFGELEILYGSSCDDKSVELLVLYILKSKIKLVKMTLGRVLSDV